MCILRQCNYIMENKKAPIWEVTYSDDYDEINGNILKITPDFLALLVQHESIIIEGRQEEDFLFSVENSSYKLRDIFLPSTMLVTKQLAQSGRPREVSYVSLETAHYLKLQPHNIEYNTIYVEMMEEAVRKELLEESQTIGQLVAAAGINASAICSRFRITPTQLQHLLKHMPVTVFHSRDLQSLEEPAIIMWKHDAILSIVRQLLPFLMELGVTGQWFTYEQVLPLGLVKHERVMQMLAKVFDMEQEGSNDWGFGLNEPMEMEFHAPLRYKLKLESMVRFVILQHFIAKQEYSAKEMDASLWNLMVTYLPLGLPSFEEQKAKRLLQQLLGEYFMTVMRQTLTVRVTYDPMLANSTLKDRLDFIRAYKKRFTLGQLRGVFIRMARAGDVQLGDILMKHFRKCGQDYELKLVIPK